MTDSLNRTPLWNNSLSEVSNYSCQYRKETERLRVSLENTRSKASILAGKIQETMPEMTLHDITHLDSLWDTGSIIAGAELILNPLEAYVFGCCALFHDLGMSLAVYSEELEDIKRSSQYLDILYELSNHPNVLTPDLEKNALAIRLRQLHAFKAREIPKMSWKLKESTTFIIDDEMLRRGLGDKIGVLSESHWWSIERIKEEFIGKEISPGLPEFPHDWEINNIKIACLLRLADYIYIDYRRAPSFQYSLTNPIGVSDNHWSFQNKLTRPSVNQNKLIFESIEPFTEEDIDSWWLCYQTISSINEECHKVDRLLEELSMPSFSARSVKGIENPITFSKHVNTQGWLPTNALYKATNISKIIERFGGEKLYGNEFYVPLRELLQNAIDAIGAKKFYETEFNGVVEVSYAKDQDGSEWIEIKDNGIGMTKSVILDALLDFGTSYWHSSQLLVDHPGMRSSKFKPVGKYGIGFFSVFMIADYIEILTKPLKGNQNALLIEFRNGFKIPPVIKYPKNEMYESGTRIRLKAKYKNILEEIANSFPADRIRAFVSESNIYKFQPHLYISESQEKTSIQKKEKIIFENKDLLPFICRLLAPAVNVDIFTKHLDSSKTKVIQSGDIMQMDKKSILKRILGIDGSYNLSKHLEDEMSILSERFSWVHNNNGELIGFSTVSIDHHISPYLNDNFHSQDELLWHHGFSYQLEIIFNGICVVNGLWEDSVATLPGIWFVENNKLSRNNSSLQIGRSDIQEWLKVEYTTQFQDSPVYKIKEPVSVETQMFYDFRLAGRFLSLGFSDFSLPVVISSNGMLSTKDFVDEVSEKDYVILYPSPILVTRESEEIDKDVFFVPIAHNQDIYSCFKQWKTNNILIDFRTFHRNIGSFSFLTQVLWSIFKSWGIENNKSVILEVFEQSILKEQFPIQVFKPSVNTVLNSIGDVYIIVNPIKTTKEKLLSMYKESTNKLGKKFYIKTKSAD